MCIALAVIGSAIVGAAATAQSNYQDAQMQKQANDTSVNLSNTAYQRATQDMEKAGLNPMLAYSQGGASTPGQGAATAQPLITPSSAMSVASTIADTKQTLQNTENAKHQQLNIDADTRGKTAAAIQQEKETAEQFPETLRGLKIKNNLSNLSTAGALNEALKEQYKIGMPVEWTNSGIQTKDPTGPIGGTPYTTQAAAETTEKLANSRLASAEATAAEYKLNKSRSESNAWGDPIMQKYGGYPGAENIVGGTAATAKAAKEAAGAIKRNRSHLNDETGNPAFGGT